MGKEIISPAELFLAASLSTQPIWLQSEFPRFDAGGVPVMALWPTAAPPAAPTLMNVDDGVCVSDSSALGGGRRRLVPSRVTVVSGLQNVGLERN